MLKIGRVGLLLTLSLAVTLPAFSQRGGRGGGAAANAAETTAYQDFTEETSALRKIQLGEDFINNPTYKQSNFRPQIDQMLEDLYAKNKDWKKVIDTAERMQKDLPGSNTRIRVAMLNQAMLAALSAGDIDKAIQLGDTVLAADPTDVNPYVRLSSAIPERLPQDAAAKSAAIAKATGYATKGIALQKPPRMADADWNGVQAELHAALGFIDLGTGKLPDAVSEYNVALKTNPKNALGQYRLGMAYLFQMQDAAVATGAAIKAADEAATAKADAAKLKALADQRDALANAAIVKRDAAIDSFAKAVAIGGAVAQPARQQLEPLYKNKNADLNGIDQFVNSKKAELGL